MDFLTYYECSRCGEKHDANEIQNICRKCDSGPLLARYDLERVAGALKQANLISRDADMWRYRELLPVSNPENIVSMGEGWTPLIKLENIGKELGLSNVYLKDEGLCPTGTFKARGASACISKLKEFGVKGVAMPTAGNAGGAFSCYGARAGMEVHISMPADAPESAVKQCSVADGRVYLIDGRITESIEFINEGISRYGWYNASTFKEPWRVEGKKTMGFELFEQFKGAVPDAILYPTGGGVGLVAIWKAFEELEAMGWISEKKTRMYSVQTEGCYRLKKALDEGKDDTEPWPDITTCIPGMAGPKKSLGDSLCLRAMRQSGGDVIVVSDNDALPDIGKLAGMEGLFVCPEGATTLTALRKGKEMGLFSKDDRIVLLNTGSGLKYLEFVKAHTFKEESGVDLFELARKM